MDSFGFMIIVGCIVIFIVLIGLAYWSERYVWNRGVCNTTGKRWKYFDTDSQGGRGYCSYDENGMRHSCWISYPGVEKHI